MCLDPHWDVHKGQSNPAAVAQSGNLYMFVMHNPVMWLDPTGLFAWNEADDHWFNLAYEVRNAGGSFSWNSAASEATVSIWGVTVLFHLGMSGARGSGSSIQVRADTFYSSIVNAAQEMILFGGHGAFGGSRVAHMHISMFMSSSRYNYLSKNGAPAHLQYFSGNIRWGSVRYAHISGGSSNENLLAVLPFATSAISVANRDAYLDRSGRIFLNHLHTGTGMITQLFDAHFYFMENHSTRFRYNLAPSVVGFNSTSVAVSLLNSVGLDPGLSDLRLGQHLGSHRAIAPSYFGN